MKQYTAHCIDGGIFCRDVKVTVDERLERMPSAQAGIINHVDTFDADGHYKRVPGKTLVSYETVAATLTADGILTIDCLCSVTTRKHVSAFLKQFCPAYSYYDAKAAFNGGYMIDVTTGAHISIETGEILNPDAVPAA